MMREKSKNFCSVGRHPPAGIWLGKKGWFRDRHQGSIGIFKLDDGWGLLPK